MLSYHCTCGATGHIDDGSVSDSMFDTVPVAMNTDVASFDVIIGIVDKAGVPNKADAVKFHDVVDKPNVDEIGND